MGLFLKYVTASQSVQLSSEATLDQLILEAYASSPSATGVLASLVWKLLPTQGVTKTGQYQIAWGDRCLGQGNGGNLPPVLVGNDKTNGSQWWNIGTQVADDGSFYYTASNFMTGDRLEINNTGAVIGGTDGTTGGRLTLDVNNNTALLSSIDDPKNILAVNASGQIVLTPKDASNRWTLLSGPAWGPPTSNVPPREPAAWGRKLTLDTWNSATAAPGKFGDLRTLDDGIYTIINESTQRVIATKASSETGKSIKLADAATKDPSLTTLWHVRRLTLYQDLVYVISAYSSDNVLTENIEEGVPLGVSGKPILDQPRNGSKPQQLFVIRPETNFAFTIKSVHTPGALGDVSILSDGLKNDALRNTPILSTLKVTQKWTFSPLPPPIASGIYRFRFSNGKLLRAALTISAAETNLTSSFANCRLAARRDGLYTIEFMTSLGLVFLGCDGSTQVCLSHRVGDNYKWKLVNTGPETPGYYIQHANTNLALRYADPKDVAVYNSRDVSIANLSLSASLSTKALGSAPQIINVELTPNSVPTVTNTDAVPSSKITPGVYRILTTRNTALTLQDWLRVQPPAIPKSEFQAVANATSSGQDNEWVVEQTGNGFYTLTNKALLLSTAIGITEKSTWPYAPTYPMAPGTFTPTNDTWSDKDVIGVSFPYEATRWKLLSLADGSFNIISKTTEGILQVDPAGSRVTVDVTVPFPALSSFSLVKVRDLPPTTTSVGGLQLPPPVVDPVTFKETPQTKGARISREVDIEAAVFSLEEFTNPHVQWGPSPRRCLTLNDADVLAKFPLGGGDAGTIRPKVWRMDVTAYSMDVGTQYWKIVKDDDGWYSIESYARGGWKLGAQFDILNGKRVWKKEPPGVVFLRPGSAELPSGKASVQWKFVQLDGRIAVVNRACDEYYLVQDGENVRFKRVNEGSPFW